MEEYVNNNINQEQNNSNAIYIFIGVFGLVLFPSLLLAILFYFVFFRWLKWKPRITFILSVLLSIIWFISWRIIDPFSNFNISKLSSYLIPYTMFALIIGVVCSFLFILWQARQLRIYPELREMKGWASKFKYAKTPLEIYSKYKMKQGCSNGKFNDYECSPLGVLEEDIILNEGEKFTKQQVISRYYSEAYLGTLISGNVGSGKSFTMMNLIRNDILAGYPICVVDFKKGPEMAYHISKLAYENGRKFFHFTNGVIESYNNPFCEYQASYDPLSTGNATSKADMVLGLREWDTASDVYKQKTMSILQAVFYLLEKVNKNDLHKIPWNEGGIAQFVAALQVPNLFDMIEWLKKDMLSRECSNSERRQLALLQGFYEELTTDKQSGLREQMQGLATICRTLIMSSYADWLTKGETPNHINLFKLATSNDAPVILFQFNPNEEPEFSKYMGNIIMNDLSRAAAYKNSKGDKTPFGLYIDEFQTLNPDSVASLVEKVRSARIFTTLSSQSLEQITKAATHNGNAILLSLLDTMSNFIIHSGSTKDTAERFSKLVGETQIITYKVMGKRKSSVFAMNWKNSRNSMVNKMLENRYKVPPEKFQSLSMPKAENNYKATAYYITKSCSDPMLSNLSEVIARKYHAIVDKSFLEPVPNEFIKNLLKPVEVRKKVKKQTKYENTQNKVSKTNVSIDKSNNNEDLLDGLDISLLKQNSLSQKQYMQNNKREILEKPKKITSFEKIKKK